MAITDPDVLKMCKESITELVEDADKNITLSMLSNNFGLDFKTASGVLKSWLNENKDRAKKVTKDFFVQYRDHKGSLHVSIVKEEKLHSVKNKYKEVVDMLYGISIVTTNNSLGLIERYENIDIPIRIESTVRQFHYQPKLNPVPETKPKEKPTSAGTKSINNMFAQGSSATSGSTSSNKATTSSSKPTTKPDLAPNKKKEPIKVEKISPKKKESPVKKASTAKTAPKGNIASFFAKAPAKPSVPKPSLVTPTEVKVEEIKTEEVKPEPSVTTATKPSKTTPDPPVNNKRSAVDSDDDDEAIPATPVEQVKRITRVSKRFKPAQSANSGQKRSRVMQIVDSSDDDEDEVKEEKIDSDVVEEKEKSRSPEKRKSPPSTVATGSKEPSSEATKGRKRKGRRQVDRTYMDEEGFIVTKKEYEEYSLSEEEVDEPKKSKIETPEKGMKSEEKAKGKSAAANNSKTKQNTLFSFFTRK